MTMNSDEVLRDVLLATVKEQRAKRRWGIFFKLIMLIFVLVILGMGFSKKSHYFKADEKFTALVDLDGIISANSQANADNIVSGIDEAFKDSDTKGIILRIDSPGGTPVQASEVYNEILRQRALHPNIKIYAVCTDICTSAAYYIASATDEIYANPSSLVGSIGVLMDGFGFTDTLQKLGIQRRLLTSGDHKGFLDPFSPLKPEDEKIAQTMLDIVHQQFIHDVMKGRGHRLNVNQDTFSGLAWTGQQARAQGLIDGFGSAGQVARDVIKAEHIEDFNVKASPLDFFADHIGASFANHITAMLGFGNMK
jgi:protease IV